MSSIYHSFIYTPLYNFLIFLFKALPWADAGIIVILFTIVVRLILFPLSKKSHSYPGGNAGNGSQTR